MMRLKRMFLVMPIFTAGLLLVGCGDGNAGGTSADQAGQDTAANQSASAAVTGPIPEAMQAFVDSGEVVEITISGNDRMQFDRDRMTVPAGAMVRLTLEHTGQLPAQSMGHNVVILVEGDDPFEFGADVNEQGGSMDNDYVPADLRDRVVAFTPIIGGGETTQVEFQAPSTPGEYPFLCSFPGHAGMMNGVVEVQ